jgi:ribosomal protein L11 methyltransferase
MPAPVTEVKIAAPSALVDELVALLAGEGFEGFWEDDAFLKCYIPRSLWSPDLEARLRDILRLSARAHNIGVPRFDIMELEYRNWNAEWEATITPIRVTERIVIAPTWHPAALRPDDIGITIDPKMSFGTGYHETTRLMLRLLEQEVREGDRVLDIGTGTGVLAIAAVILGATSALGVDTDEWSIENAVENAAINHVADRIEFRHGDLRAAPEAGFTLILANIQKAVLDSMLGDIRARMTPKGRVLFSGLLSGDRLGFLESLGSAGLIVSRELSEHEWLALSCAPRE